MIREDTLMRYIRIFSELSNQIRYASQKRILVEIALIKLCRPSMEVSQDALLDRIRQVEGKWDQTLRSLESGAYAVPGAGAAGGMGPGFPGSGGPTGTGAYGTNAAPLPKAIPEDIREIVSKWPSIVGNAENPMKMYLKSVRLSLGNEGQLLIVAEDGLVSDYFGDHGHREELERLLADFSGKEVEVALQSVKTEQEMEQNYVDLSQVIHMEIEEED